MHCIENCPVQKGCPWFFSLLVLFSAKLCLYTAITLQALKNIETLWPMHTLSQRLFLLFGGSAKLYIPSAKKNKIISIMTGVMIMSSAKKLFGSLVHKYCTFFFPGRLGRQGRTAILLKVSYFWGSLFMF